MSKWINVEIEYPECHVNVLLTDGQTIGFGYREQNNRYTHWKLHQSLGWITHWMPLPCTPDEEERIQNERNYLNTLENR